MVPHQPSKIGTLFDGEEVKVSVRPGASQSPTHRCPADSPEGDATDRVACRRRANRGATAYGASSYCHRGRAEVWS